MTFLRSQIVSEPNLVPNTHFLITCIPVVISIEQQILHIPCLNKISMPYRRGEIKKWYFYMQFKLNISYGSPRIPGTSTMSQATCQAPSNVEMNMISLLSSRNLQSYSKKQYGYSNISKHWLTYFKICEQTQNLNLQTLTKKIH